MKKMILIVLVVLQSCGTYLLETEIKVDTPPQNWIDNASSWNEDDYWGWVRWNTDYIADDVIFGDCWRSPANFVRNSGGDCEDYVVMAMWFFHEILGYDKDELMFISVPLPDDVLYGHAVLWVDGIIYEAQAGIIYDSVTVKYTLSYTEVMKQVYLDQR